jgi:broad specificity phosphatase PhoE
MFKTTIIFEVLSAESLGDMELDDIIRECNEGSFSGDTKVSFEERVADSHMACLLEAQRSSPEFLLGDGWAAKEELNTLLVAADLLGESSPMLSEKIADLREEIERGEW